MKIDSKKPDSKSHIPLLKKNSIKEAQEINVNNKQHINKRTDVKTECWNIRLKKENLGKDISEILPQAKCTESNVTSKKVTLINSNTKIVKENSMSLDSLEENTPQSNVEKTCQSIGINTELLCVPCIIHDSLEQKRSGRKNKPDIKGKEKDDKRVSEPKIELIYKNLAVVSSCDIRHVDSFEEPDSKVDLSPLSNRQKWMIPTDSDVITNDDSITNFNSNTNNNKDLSVGNTSPVIVKIKSDEMSNDKLNLKSQAKSFENLEENYEDNLTEVLSSDSMDIKYDEEKSNSNNNIECRFGSGETYTKFTEDPASLEEFMNLTDKMINDKNLGMTKSDMTTAIVDLHTPRTNSIENINQISTNNELTNNAITLSQPFSDTFEELKYNLKNLIETARSSVIPAMINIEDMNDALKMDRKVSNLEHITIYELNSKEKISSESVETKPLFGNENKLEFSLPSISETNKPERKVYCTKSRLQKIYKTTRKCKMLSDEKRTNKEYQTFIIKPDNDDNSDSQSISSEAPPLKLPRIDNKRLHT